MKKLLAGSVAVSLLAMLPQGAVAQAQQSPASASTSAPASTPAQNLLKAEELDQLLAPIALYPDALLSEVLMASTYPLEVVEASRWADENRNLKDAQLKAAADKQSWDNSVKSLTATPSVLNMMSTKLSWTQKLGDAVLAQQADVMDSVQRLRARAQAQNKLQSTKEQKVSTRTEQNRQVIVIEPTDPNTLYVPYYDPSVVYGAWPYPAYPPYYYPPAPGYYAGAAIASGLAFGAGVAVGAWAANGHYWGGGFGWGGNNINVNRQVNINNANINNRWQHNPDHRHGVRYNNAAVASKFNRANAVRGGAQNRMDFRGRGGQQAQRSAAGANAANRGNRPGARGGGERRQTTGSRGGVQRTTAGKQGAGRRQNAGRGGRENAFANAGGRGRQAYAQSLRGHASLAAHPNFAGRAGGFRGGGGGFRGGGGFHGRRSDINLKHDVVLLGHLDNGLGFYRFAYKGSDKLYVGVIAQEVQTVMPDAVTRGADGYLRVYYEKLGVKFQTYAHWIASGARIPADAAVHSNPQ